MGLEGIVSKRADAPYRSGRGEQWLKVKSWKQGRFTEPRFALSLPIRVTIPSREGPHSCACRFSSHAFDRLDVLFRNFVDRPVHSTDDEALRTERIDRI